ncbi:MAG: hypothetical protein U0521_05810 [Anaerolineae bacterium]
MIELLPRMKQHFDTTQDRFITFCNLGFQSEGWFKGELVNLFSQLQREGVIQELDREVKVGTKRIDVMIRLNDMYHWIELKHWMIGIQKGSYYSPSFSFGDPTSVGIISDVDKLNTLIHPGHRWILVLLTANPGAKEWEAGIEKFNRKFAPRRVESRTQPDAFPSTYFLGLLDLGSKLKS